MYVPDLAAVMEAALGPPAVALPRLGIPHVVVTSREVRGAACGGARGVVHDACGQAQEFLPAFVQWAVARMAALAANPTAASTESQSQTATQ